ncbi:jhy protein homolog isoform X1 [Notothenia coriiceps]|uniref:Jhy protein homolog isoform X1 n=1 Tax=Notothenia coriiceps TaxID=8208 RepID=A0A6I9NWX2_9TELE|nr:PREDICTED: uncharacterized protein C11orf63 homolog isoform X1 [Notothenia coriiceps]
MDKDLKNEPTSQGWKTEQEKLPAPRQQWDSVESDTESLAQESAYQQQIHMDLIRHHQNKYTLPQKKKDDSLQPGYQEGEDARDDEALGLQVVDSLDLAAKHRAKRSHTLTQTEYLDTQTNERGGTSQQPTQDSYSDLRYDPNWRTNLRGAGRFDDSPHISVEEYYQDPKEKSSQSCCDRQGLVMKGGYRYIVNSCPAVAVTPHLACDESEPYCLHPQNAQTGSATPPHHELQPPSPEADHSKPPCGKNTLKGFRRKSVNSCDNAGENRRSTELTKDATYIQSKAYLLQELRSTQGGTTQIQQISTSKYPKVSLNKKLESLAEDIVERNKMTLGRNSSKRGSYVSVHALKQERPHKVNKFTQISEEKKTQREEYPNPQQRQQQPPPSPGVTAEWGDCLSSTLATPASVTQPNPQKTSSSQPLLPSIHLNIHLNNSHLHPFIQRGGQDDIINLTPPHWSPPSEVELAFFPGCQQTNHYRILKSSSEQWQRTTALQWPLSCEGEHHKCPTEAHTKPFPQNLPGTPSTTLSPGSGLAVLPPIRESMTGREPENTESHTDGYRKLRTRATYKAYSLKEYKQLKSDIHLRGLGPDYTAAEQTKMKRQKLYSNVIREQNKSISRIPFLLAKDPEGSDKKVPRVKALEYAKTIAKPVASQTPKQREQRSEGSTERAPYLEGLDHPPPDTLEVLRQRHEEEKQAVALFRRVHAV